MATAEELIVAIKSEGVGETQQDLEGVERSMENTADSAGDSAEELEGFSKRFQGAMQAAVAALAIGAAGLLTQVPVLQEAFSGLNAVISGVAFQMDRFIRSIGGEGLSELLFNISNGLFEMEGGMANLVGAVSTVLSALGALGAILQVIQLLTPNVDIWAKLIPVLSRFGAVVLSFGSRLIPVIVALGGVLKAAAVAIGSFVAGLSALTIGLAVAVAALLAFVAAYLTNWRGTRDKTDAIVSDIIDFVVGGFRKFGTMALNALTDFASDARRAFGDFGEWVSDWASGLSSDAYDWGKSLIERFISGIESAIGRLRDFLGDLRDLGGQIGIDVPDLGGLGGGGGGSSGGSSSGRPRFGGGTTTGGTQLDGRQLTESTGRYRSDPNLRRGI